MTSNAKTPEYWISYLMTVIDNIPAKPDWNEVARTTGAYKSGKFANQAYANLRKRYPAFSDGNTGQASAPATPKSTKKRAVATDLGEDDEDAKPKSAKKRRTPKKEVIKDEIEEAKVEMIKVEGSDDELNGDVTINGDDDEDED